jgi:hypothetical protein
LYNSARLFRITDVFIKKLFKIKNVNYIMKNAMKNSVKSSMKSSVKNLSAQLDIASKQADILARKAAQGKSRDSQIDLVKIFSYIASVSLVTLIVFTATFVFVPDAREFTPFPFNFRYSGIVDSVLLFLTYAAHNLFTYIFLTTLGIASYVGAQKIEDEIIREDELIKHLEIAGAHSLEDKPVKRAMQRLIAGEEKAKEKTEFIPGTVTHADFAENVDLPIGVAAADNGGGGLEAVPNPINIPPDHELESIDLSKEKSSANIPDNNDKKTSSKSRKKKSAENIDEKKDTGQVEPVKQSSEESNFSEEN